MFKKFVLTVFSNLVREAWFQLSHYPVKNNLSRSCHFVCRSEISLFQQNEAVWQSPLVRILWSRTPFGLEIQ